MLMVYVAGPFRADTDLDKENNIRRAEELAMKCWALETVAVICPHTNARFQNGLPDKVFLDGDLEMIKRCDGMIVVEEGWEQSEGTLGEIDLCRELGIPVFFKFEEFAGWVENYYASGVPI